MIHIVAPTERGGGGEEGGGGEGLPIGIPAKFLPDSAQSSPIQDFPQVQPGSSPHQLPGRPPEQPGHPLQQPSYSSQRPRYPHQQLPSAPLVYREDLTRTDWDELTIPYAQISLITQESATRNLDADGGEAWRKLMDLIKAPEPKKRPADDFTGTLVRRRSQPSQHAEHESDGNTDSVSLMSLSTQSTHIDADLSLRSSIPAQYMYEDAGPLFQSSLATQDTHAKLDSFLLPKALATQETQGEEGPFFRSSLATQETHDKSDSFSRRALARQHTLGAAVPSLRSSPATQDTRGKAGLLFRSSLPTQYRQGEAGPSLRSSLATRGTHERSDSSSRRAPATQYTRRSRPVTSKFAGGARHKRNIGPIVTEYDC